MERTCMPNSGIGASTSFATRGNDRLLMVFLGWGMSPGPFMSLSKPGYDVLLLWNYREQDGAAFADDMRDALAGYSEIVVVAWSFGVVAASYIVDALGALPFTRKVAVNGTPRHIDRREGIPPAVFALTLRGLSPAAVEKFNGRMFASEDDRARFDSFPSVRGFESVLEELRFFGLLPPYDGSCRWNFAVIGGRDAIFPPANQSACWQSARCGISVLPEAGHYIDIQAVIDDFVVDKELVASRFGAAKHTYRDNAAVQRRVAEKLWSLAAPLIAPEPETVVEVGVGGGLLTELYSAALRPGDLLLLDIADVDTSRFPCGARFLRCDAETAMPRLRRSSVDAILSASTLQWFHDPESFVANAFEVLKPGGILALSFFGEGTCREVAEATGISLKYPDPSGWRSCGDVLLSESETLTESFSDAMEAVRHISRTGVNALRRDAPASAGAVMRLLRGLPKDSSGRVRLSYVPYYMIIRKPIE